MGCLQELTVNSVLIELEGAGVSELGNDPPAALPGCSREMNCVDGQCGPQGLCISHWDNYTCQCTDDYVGQNCQKGEASATI